MSVLSSLRAAERRKENLSREERILGKIRRNIANLEVEIKLKWGGTLRETAQRAFLSDRYASVRVVSPLWYHI